MSSSRVNKGAIDILSCKQRSWSYPSRKLISRVIYMFPRDSMSFKRKKNLDFDCQNQTELICIGHGRRVCKNWADFRYKLNWSGFCSFVQSTLNLIILVFYSLHMFCSPFQLSGPFFYCHQNIQPVFKPSQAYENLKMLVIGKKETQ